LIHGRNPEHEAAVRISLAAAVLIGCLGCGKSAAPDAWALGLNDLSVLVPLPADAGPVVLSASTGDAGAELLPRVLYDRLVADGPFGGRVVFDHYERLQVTAVRFDLCDRLDPGACPKGEDGRIRLVFQPLLQGGARDIGFHAFYVVPANDVNGLIVELLSLSAQGGTPSNSLLQVSPALASAPSGPYATHLRELLERTCGTQNLDRVTMLAQPDIFAQVRWIFRGLERRDGAFEELAIAGLDAGTQELIFEADADFDVLPVADAPLGFQRALQALTFSAATPEEQTASLKALTEIENPMLRGVRQLQCASCHVSTAVLARRAPSPFALPGRYTSAFDLSVDGGRSQTTGNSVHAFGWLGTEPMISQRVVNETAQVLWEVNQQLGR
jgi:hypothetical protein